MAVAEPIPQGHHPTLPRIEHVQHGLPDLLAEHRVLHRVEWALLLGLLEQVPQLGVLTHRGLQRHRLAALGLQQAIDLIQRDDERLGQLLGRGVPAHPLAELDPRPPHLADLVVDVDGQPDLPASVRDRPGDGLTDPPRRVRGELEAAAPVEQLDRPHQPDVAFLDQVEEGQPLSLVLPGDRNHQSEVGSDEPLPCLPALAYHLFGLANARFRLEPPPL